MTASDRLVIRTGLPTDASALAGFGALTFRSTYAADTPTQALDGFVERVFGPRGPGRSGGGVATPQLAATVVAGIVGAGLLRLLLSS